MRVRMCWVEVFGPWFEAKAFMRDATYDLVVQLLAPIAEYHVRMYSCLSLRRGVWVAGEEHCQVEAIRDCGCMIDALLLCIGVMFSDYWC